MEDFENTICALSTPPGCSGIAVVRITGNRSLSLLQTILFLNKPSNIFINRNAMLGRIVDPRDGMEIDEAIGTFFGAPNSYTGEDMAELSLHGSPVLVSALLDCLCALGARLAMPGEFTMRAFLHGKMDLTQAEAIRDVIEAKTLFQAQTAGRQRSGAISQQLSPIKDMLVDVIVHLESAVEFVEENLPVDSRNALVLKLSEVQKQVRSWIDSYRKGKIVRDGFSMAVVGRPNVGKSSLFNAILAKNRSIVAEMPGTTRDLVSEFTSIEGIPVHLQDTAGIHNSEDYVENLGIDRSIQAIGDSDAIILVIDSSRECSEEDMHLKSQLEHFSSIVLFNKSDLPSRWSFDEKSQFAGNRPFIETSAKTGSGIENLRSTILESIFGAGGIPCEGMLITNLRHCHCMENVEKHIVLACAALKEGLSEEFVLLDLHKGLENLGGITGEMHVDDLLAEIFSRFCVGK
jgi:tRNA modification GTPase